MSTQPNIDTGQENREIEARRESAKLFYDMFKHITTLATGTVVVLSTFLEKIFKSPVWLPLVVATFVGLVISLVCSLGTMFFMAVHAKRQISSKEANWVTGMVFVCFLSFLIAIACLTAFAAKNFLT